MKPDAVTAATAWLVKAQLPLDPAVLRVTLPPGQPPLELKPALANSLRSAEGGEGTRIAVVGSRPVGMTKVKVPIPPPALKVKLPPPPLVCLDTVRLATAWLVKAQLPLDPAVPRDTVPPPLCTALGLRAALANSLTLTEAWPSTVN